MIFEQFWQLFKLELIEDDAFRANRGPIFLHIFLF